MLRLIVVEGEKAGEAFVSDQAIVTIGSAADNEIRLVDPYISRHHGLLSLTDGRWIYKDLGSTNGSIVARAGERLVLNRENPEIELQKEDVLILGETVLRLDSLETEQEELERALIASRTLEDLAESHQRQLANLDDLLEAYQFEKQLGLVFDPEQMLEVILEATLKAFPRATHVILLLVDKKTGKPRRKLARVRGEAGRAPEDIPVSMSVANRVLQEGKSLLFRDVAAEFGDSQSVVAAGISSSLCVPLWTGDETMGLMQVESRGGRVSFTERDLERLSLFANRAALAILGSELCESEHRNQLLRDLSAMITHDLKGPLTTIMGFLGLLADEPLTANQKEYVEVALADSKWLAVLIAGILDAAKMEAGEVKLNLAPIAIGENIQEALHLIAYQLKEKDIRLETSVAEALSSVRADQEIFRRIVVNLVGNAVKFAPQGSRLMVEAARNAAGDAVVISVQDEGPGIAKEHQAKIFDKFVQVGKGHGAEKISVGLGLAFCKLAIDAHGGNIWVESEPGHGARFSFSLPLR